VSPYIISPHEDANATKGRRRRIKCDEQKPLCHKCHRMSLDCTWPASDEFCDKRFRPSHKSTSPTRNSTKAINFPRSEEKHSSTIREEMQFREIIPAFPSHRNNLEEWIFGHFFLVQQPRLILPTAHPGFIDAFVPKVMNLSYRFEGLRNAVLANGASHLFASTGNPNFLRLSLEYYSAAVYKVAQALKNMAEPECCSNDALLLAVIYLYMHGVCKTRRSIPRVRANMTLSQFWGFGTENDVPKHVAGAIQILRRRLATRQKYQPFDRIAVESALYQSFRVSALSPYSYDTTPDLAFWSESESIIGSQAFQDSTNEANRPVMGMPLQLQQFIVRMVAFTRQKRQPQIDELFETANEMAKWMECTDVRDPSTAADSGETMLAHKTTYQLTTTLYILAASVIFQQFLNRVSRNLGASVACSSEIEHHWWQVQVAAAILGLPNFSSQWTLSFLGSWPTYILGLVATRPEDIAVLRNDVSQRWSNIRCSEAYCVLKSLESEWQCRGVLQQVSGGDHVPIPFSAWKKI
jgi:hypothetical protein